MSLFMIVEVIPSLLNMKANDRLNWADHQAKSTCRMAERFADRADTADCVTVIAQYGDTDTPLKAYIHEQESQYASYHAQDWYAVVFRDGRVQFALYSGHKLTYADLREPDRETELRKVRKPGTSPGDAIGYYKAPEPTETAPS